ncbi:MAG: succinylglutamate desuccinylase/aspartoacylase family protein [Candidatus Gracilibacteria bacterium]
MKVTTLKSENKGKNALILGGIHGDEKSGSIAIKKFINDIQTETISILSGSVTLISNCNEKAGIENRRYLENNLNRCFYEGQNLQSYEGDIARKIMPFFNETNYLLDIHSTSGPSIPFLFSENRNIEIAKNLGVSHVVLGWNDLGSVSISGDTENYMNNKGGYGFTFEAGNHDNSEGPNNAYKVLLNFLSNLGIINSNLFSKLSKEKSLIQMSSVYVCKFGNFEFKLGKNELENFSFIKSGTLIGIDGIEKIYAEKDMILVMPNLANPKKGEDVFFVGEKIKIKNL